MSKRINHSDVATGWVRIAHFFGTITDPQKDARVRRGVSDAGGPEGVVERPDLAVNLREIKPASGAGKSPVIGSLYLGELLVRLPVCR
jgi:hypothetical protein